MVFKVKDELNLHLKDHEGLENSQGIIDLSFYCAFIVSIILVEWQN